MKIKVPLWISDTYENIKYKIEEKLHPKPEKVKVKTFNSTGEIIDSRASPAFRKRKKRNIFSSFSISDILPVIFTLPVVVIVFSQVLGVMQSAAANVTADVATNVTSNVTNVTTGLASLTMISGIIPILIAVAVIGLVVRKFI